MVQIERDNDIDKGGRTRLFLRSETTTLNNLQACLRSFERSDSLLGRDKPIPFDRHAECVPRFVYVPNMPMMTRAHK